MALTQSDVDVRVLSDTPFWVVLPMSFSAEAGGNKIHRTMDLKPGIGPLVVWLQAAMQKVITLNPPVYLEFLKEHGGEAMGHGGVGLGALKKYLQNAWLSCVPLIEIP